MTRQMPYEPLTASVLLGASFIGIQALDEPLHGRAQGVRAGLVVKLDGNGDQCPALPGQVGVELSESLRRCARSGRHGSVRRLAELGFDATDDGNDTVAGAEMPKQELAARSLREREQCAGVNGAEMVEILPTGRETEKLRRIASRLDAEEGVEREFCDAVLQVWCSGWLLLH